MTKKTLLLLIVISITTFASAKWVPLTGDPVSISSLQNGSLIFGDKELSDISLFGIGAGGGAIAPTADSLYIQGGQDTTTGDYGLRFLLSWNAASNQTVNATLSFTVSVLPRYDDYFINDVEMYITGSSAVGSGVVNVGETVWGDEPFAGGNVIASLSCAKYPNDGGAYLIDHAEFAPVKKIWIFSKDISITGGTDGSAHISELFQFYSQSQVPEPATISLLCLGGLATLTRKKRG